MSASEGMACGFRRCVSVLDAADPQKRRLCRLEKT